VLSGLHFHHGVEESTVAAASSYQFLVGLGAGIPMLLSVYLYGTRLTVGSLSRFPADLPLLAIEVAWGLLSGSRLLAITPLVVFAVMRALCGRPMRLRQATVALFLFVAVVFPFLTAYRVVYSTTSREADAPALAANVGDSLARAIAEERSGPASVNGGDSAVELVADRFHGLTSLALVIRHTPERHEWMLGVPVLLVPANIFIPRAVWPSKPGVSEFANVFRFDYWGLTPGDSTGVAPSMLGDLWAQFHVIGVALGSILYGVFIALVMEHARFGLVGSSTFPKAVGASMVVPILHSFENCLDGALAGHTKTVLVYAAVGLLLSRRAAAGSVRAAGRGANTAS
jgi:hypothetical protein